REYIRKLFDYLDISHSPRRLLTRGNNNISQKCFTTPAEHLMGLQTRNQHSTGMALRTLETQLPLSRYPKQNPSLLTVKKCMMLTKPIYTQNNIIIMHIKDMN